MNYLSQPLLLILALSMLVAVPAVAVEIKLACGVMSGSSARLGTETKPATLERDEIINGRYTFDLSSKSGHFIVVFNAIEGPITRQVDDLDLLSNGQTIKITSRPQWGEQVFHLHIGQKEKRMLTTSETKLLSGEIQVAVYDAACEPTN
ncbi:MAG: hypothetical protein ACRCU5_15570 [Rhizobiaceae bacterium]